MRISAMVGLAVVGLATAAALAAPAQAYNPDPTQSFFTRSTTDCPCWYNDEIDGTHFKRDKGGRAIKTELRMNGKHVGKVEFHPYNEEVWLYDTRNDGDTFYVEIRYYSSKLGLWVSSYVYPKGTSKKIDISVRDLDIDEGRTVYMKLWDNRRFTDKIGSTIKGRA